MNKLFIIFSALFFSQILFSQVDDDFKKDAFKAIELSGAAKQLEITKNQFLKMVPKEKQNDFNSDFEKSLPKVYENFAKLYMKLYTKEDLKAMIAFYESPVGKKIYSNSEELALRSQSIGQEWMLALQELLNKYKLP